MSIITTNTSHTMRDTQQRTAPGACQAFRQPGPVPWLDTAARGVISGYAQVTQDGRVSGTHTLAHSLGFQPLPGGFFAALAGMVACYLALIETGKRIFYGAAPTTPLTRPRYSRHRHLRRRAAYFSTATRQPALSATTR
jgi:hypothetical protein